MKRRIFQAFGFAVVMTALAAAFMQSAASGQAPAPGGAAGTAGAAKAKAGPAPKTPWGHPDLQGIWLDEFDTPLERPARYANKEFFTEEERTAQDDERSGNVGPQRARRSGAAGRTSPAPTTRCSPRRSRPAGARRSSSTRQTAESPRLTPQMPGAEPSRPGVPPGAPSEHRHLQEQDDRLRRWQVRSAVAEAQRRAPVLQHAAHEPPRRP